jgi:hypothetical protein
MYRYTSCTILYLLVHVPHHNMSREGMIQYRTPYHRAGTSLIGVEMAWTVRACQLSGSGRGSRGPRDFARVGEDSGSFDDDDLDSAQGTSLGFHCCSRLANSEVH